MLPDAHDQTIERLASIEASSRLALSKLEEVETALQGMMQKIHSLAVKNGTVRQEEFRSSIMPYLERLKATVLSKEQTTLLDLLEGVFLNHTSPFHIKISSPELRLSPTETHVARLIRDGKSNKEIAELMHLSVSTILTHRHHIRTKLGLKHQKKNLRSVLQRL